MIHSLHILGECDTRNKNLYIFQHKKRAKNENEKETMREKGEKNEKKIVPRVRIELTTFRCLLCDYETDALPTALTRHFLLKWAAKELNKHS